LGGSLLAMTTCRLLWFDKVGSVYIEYVHNLLVGSSARGAPHHVSTNLSFSNVQVGLQPDCNCSPKSKGLMVGPYACKHCGQKCMQGNLCMHGRTQCMQTLEKRCLKKMHASEFCEKEKVWLQSKLNS